MKIGTGQRLGHSVGHFLRTDDVDAPDGSGGLQLGGAADQSDIGARFRARGGHGVTHLAGTAVAEVTHRVDGFAGRTGSDQHIQSGQGAAAKALIQGSHDRPWLQHAARTGLAAGLSPRCRSQHLHTSPAQGG